MIFSINSTSNLQKQLGDEDSDEEDFEYSAYKNHESEAFQEKPKT